MTAIAEFSSFDEAAEWVDDHTTPANAGRFLIQETGGGQYSVMLSAALPLDTQHPQGQ